MNQNCPACHINRITVEFKFCKRLEHWLYIRILIESQWNLNDDFLYNTILISSILIESQWNLNSHGSNYELRCAQDINRITVEFKFLF